MVKNVPTYRSISLQTATLGRAPDRRVPALIPPPCSRVRTLGVLLLALEVAQFRRSASVLCLNRSHLRPVVCTTIREALWVRPGRRGRIVMMASTVTYVKHPSRGPAPVDRGLQQQRLRSRYSIVSTVGPTKDARLRGSRYTPVAPSRYTPFCTELSVDGGDGITHGVYLLPRESLEST